MSTQPIAHLTLEQYLEMKRAADFRIEYINGQVYAMAGASVNHALIALDVAVLLLAQLRGRPCAVAGSDLRLFCEPAKMPTYPDVVVICRPRRFLDVKKDTRTDATVIVEVLSPSTQNYNGGEKFRFYRLCPLSRNTCCGAGCDPGRTLCPPARQRLAAPGNNRT